LCALVEKPESVAESLHHGAWEVFKKQGRKKINTLECN
jgi:hypothetical protein